MCIRKFKTIIIIVDVIPKSIMKKYDQQTNKHIAEKKLCIHEEICFFNVVLGKKSDCSYNCCPQTHNLFQKLAHDQLKHVTCISFPWNKAGDFRTPILCPSMNKNKIKPACTGKTPLLNTSK